MEKLVKVSNEVYLLMQDIVKLTEKKINKDSPTLLNMCDWFDIKIAIEELILYPTNEQLEKALLELKFLIFEWIKCKCEQNKKELLYFIDRIKYDDKSLFFKISSLRIYELDQVKFNLNKYIDTYVD